MSDELPTLHTARLSLRAFGTGDVADVQGYLNDEEWARYEPDYPQPFERADAERFVARRIVNDWEAFPFFAIELSGAVVGAGVEPHPLAPSPSETDREGEGRGARRRACVGRVAARAVRARGAGWTEGAGRAATIVRRRGVGERCEGEDGGLDRARWWAEGVEPHPLAPSPSQSDREGEQSAVRGAAG